MVTAELGKTWQDLATLLNFLDSLAYWILASHSPVWLMLARESMAGPGARHLAVLRSQ
jgi:hypothetical protein